MRHTDGDKVVWYKRQCSIIFYSMSFCGRLLFHLKQPECLVSWYMVGDVMSTRVIVIRTGQGFTLACGRSSSSPSGGAAGA